MGVISFRVTDEIERELREKAIARKQKLTEFCRDRIAGEDIREVNPVILEDRIEKLEYIIGELIKEQEFLTQFIYEFMCMAKDKAYANEAIKRAKES